MFDYLKETFAVSLDTQALMLAYRSSMNYYLVLFFFPFITSDYKVLFHLDKCALAYLEL